MPIAKLIRLASLSALIAALAAPAGAQDDAAPDSFTDRLAAEGLEGCSVSAPPLVFTVPLSPGSSIRSTTPVLIVCTPRVDFAVGIDRGLHALGVNRRMRNAAGASYIRYAIYSDPAYRRAWTDKKNQMVAGNSGASGRRTLTAYGEVANLGGAPSGAYADAVTITIDF